MRVFLIAVLLMCSTSVLASEKSAKDAKAAVAFFLQLAITCETTTSSFLDVAKADGVETLIAAGFGRDAASSEVANIESLLKTGEPSTPTPVGMCDGLRKNIEQNRDAFRARLRAE